jgi:hypothetical protein
MHVRADCLDNVGSSISHNPVALHCLLQGLLCFLFVNDVRISQETSVNLSFTFPYVDDARTSQETHL